MRSPAPVVRAPVRSARTCAIPSAVVAALTVVTLAACAADAPTAAPPPPRRDVLCIQQAMLGDSTVYVPVVFPGDECPVGYDYHVWH